MFFTKKVMIDPVQQNITNRIAAGTVLKGEYMSKEGLLVQGSVCGEPLVIEGGILIIEAGGQLLGRVRVMGDCYIFGQAGDPSHVDGGLDLEVYGTIHVAATGVTHGAIAFHHLASYEGSSLNSKARSIPLHIKSPYLSA